MKLPLLIFFCLCGLPLAGYSQFQEAANAKVKDEVESEVGDEVFEGLKNIELPDIRTVDQGRFIVVYKDRTSGRVVTRICNEYISILKRFFEMSDEKYTKAIVQLIPRSEVKFETPYQVLLSKGGSITLSIAWDEKSDFRTVCQAIARGFLMVWVRDNYGYDRAASIPAWVALAFSMYLEVHLYPGNRELLKYEARSIPVLSIDQVVAKDAGVKQKVDDLTRHSYWLFEFLRKNSDRQSDFGRFLKGVLAGADSMRLINKHYLKEEADRKDSYLWWAVGVQSLVGSGSSWLYTMDESRTILHQLGSVTVELYGADTKLDLNQIWELRNESAVKAAVAWTLRDIKLELYNINPVYHNCMHSLGLVYEALQGRNLKLFNQRLAIFSRDYFEAKALESGISDLLEGKKMSAGKRSGR